MLRITEIDLKIALEFDLNNLTNFCLINKDLNLLCESDYFWFSKYKHDKFIDLNLNLINAKKEYMNYVKYLTNVEYKFINKLKNDGSKVIEILLLREFVNRKNYNNDIIEKINVKDEKDRFYISEILKYNENKSDTGVVINMISDNVFEITFYNLNMDSEHSIMYNYKEVLDFLVIFEYFRRDIYITDFENVKRKTTEYDFDTDEMDIFIPQSLESIVELKKLGYY